MPKATCKKRGVNKENNSTQLDRPRPMRTDSGVSGLGLGSSLNGSDFATNKYLNIEEAPENYLEPSPEDQIETGISEIMKSCYEKLNSINEAKKQRMEQQVYCALKVSNAKTPFNPNLLKERQAKLKELIPSKFSGKLENDFLKTQSDCEKSISTIQKLMKIHKRVGFDGVLLSEVTEFKRMSENLVNAIDKHEVEQVKQTIKMQHELKEEMVLLQNKVLENKPTGSSGLGNSYKGKFN